MEINYKKIRPEQIEEVFEKNNVYFDRDIRIEALRKVLLTKYETEKKELEEKKETNSSEMSIKEFIRLNRLENYNTLSEFQLENDHEYYNDKALTNEYLQLFWDKVSAHIQTLSNSDAVFEDLHNLEQSEVKVQNVFDYNQVFRLRVLDPSDYFDGIHLVESVRHFNDTSVATEIRLLSNKYNIFIPKYWTKSDLQKRLKKELKLKGELTPSMIVKIDSSSVKKLKELLEQFNIDSKSHITKTDMIDIIIKNVDKNKVTEIAQEKEVEIDVPDEVVPVEEVKEEVQEEVIPVVKEEVVVVQNPQNEELMKIIIQNQEIIMKQFEQMNVEKVSQQQQETPMFTKTFNIVLLVLISIVSIIWIIYGINFLTN